MPTEVNIDQSELEKLLQAAFQVGKDRNLENITDGDRAKHIEDLINEAIPIALKIGIANSEKGVKEYYGNYV
jgi:hypothetical protein